MHPTKDKKKAVASVADRPMVQPVEGVEVVEEKPMKANKTVIYAVYAILVVLGIGTGYVLSGRLASQVATGAAPGMIKTDKVAGSTDAKTFKDSAEGTIEKGGIDGEGTHKLIREGGPSQTAYLISSVVDLDEFAGKKVKVWGQTIAAQKASWLMDVGKVELTE